MFQMTLFIQFPYFAAIKRIEIENVKVSNLQRYIFISAVLITFYIYV
jgi:hypothetical protein